MFQVGSNCQLCDLPGIYSEEVTNIHLRGYLEEKPVLVPSEFSSIKALSVNLIADTRCPSRRDLFIRVKKGKEGKSNWGKVSGPIIESYCKGLIDKYKDIYYSGATINYVAIKNLIKEYVRQYLDENNVPKKLEKYAIDATKSIKVLRLTLENIGCYELALLGSDCLFTNSDPANSLLSRVPIDYHEPQIAPNKKILGINTPSTPDFIIEQLQIIGDVKSGKSFKDYHRLTCTGYALAYESAYGQGHEINFGIIYFVETQTVNITPARNYTFLIDDELREEFLRRRNDAYAVLSKSTPPSRFKASCAECNLQDECSKI